MPNSYEHSYQHDLDNVIDASDAVLAIGTEKVDITTLKDRSLTGNDATIYGAMRASGYFDGGRIYDGISSYLDCGTAYETISGTFSTIVILKPSDVTTRQDVYSATLDGFNRYAITLHGEFKCGMYNGTSNVGDISSGAVSANRTYILAYTNDNADTDLYIDTIPKSGVNVSTKTGNVHRAIGGLDGAVYFYKNEIHAVLSYTTKLSLDEIKSFFNNIAHLPLYSHNFERYPNSDTSLTSVFPYTSGIITSGSFNKTDGLKCTSAGQIIFSNSFEFDGNEYITLIINGIEYSGTTTVTQGTITATIAQGSNDITIDMGTGDVLPDIRIQFREEV